MNRAVQCNKSNSFKPHMYSEDFGCPDLQNKGFYTSPMLCNFILSGPSFILMRSVGQQFYGVPRPSGQNAARLTDINDVSHGP